MKIKKHFSCEYMEKLKWWFTTLSFPIQFSVGILKQINHIHVEILGL